MTTHRYIKNKFSALLPFFVGGLLLLGFITVIYTYPSAQHAQAVTCGFGADNGSGVCVGYLTSGTSWPVPSDWNNANYSIACVGAGGNSSGLGGAGGGAYAQVSSSSLSSFSGTISYQVGTAGGTAGAGTAKTANSWFKDATTLVCAGGVTATSSNGTIGGILVTTVGTVKYAGGKGGDGVAGSYGGGGGGAAGSSGAGYAGAAATASAAGGGGRGDLGAGGVGGAGATATTIGFAGGDGAEWDSTHGSGGGGGGANKVNSKAGGNGGQYGGGAGGSVINNTGGGGVIRIVYTPLAPAPTVSVSATDAAAAENPLDTGTYTFTGSGTGSSVAVTFVKSGAAAYGTDYTLAGGGAVPCTGVSATGATVPIGSSCTVVLTPLNDLAADTDYVATLDATLTLSSSVNYTPSGSPATITITTNDYIVGSAPNNAASMTIADYAGTASPVFSGKLTATPSRVKKGGSVSLAWTGTGLPTAANGCTITRLPGGATQAVTSGASSGTAASTYTILQNITQTTIFTLTCGTVSESTSVSVYPSYI